MTMTDATNGIQVTPEALMAKYQEIAAIDEQLAAASGSTNVGKRALANSLMTDNTEVWQSLASQVVEVFKGVEDVETLVAAYTGVVETLKNEFSKSVDEYLEKQVAENQTETPDLNETQIAELEQQGRELREQYNALRSILDMFKMDIAHVPVPKRLSGSRGPRGPRTLSSFDYFIDGTERSKSQNSLSSIASTVCSDIQTPEGHTWKTKNLRDFLVEKGLDINNPPDEWEFTLPNGKVIKAVKNAEKDVYSASDDDDEPDNNDDDVVDPDDVTSDEPATEVPTTE